MSAEDVLRLEQILFGGLFLVVLLLVFVVMPILIWRGRLRRQGYPSLRAYFRELPRTDEEKLNAVEYDPERCGSLPPRPALSADPHYRAGPALFWSPEAGGGETGDQESRKESDNRRITLTRDAWPGDCPGGTHRYGQGRRDLAAVHAVRAGDVQAFATIVRRFQASILTLCVAILRDRQAAEELAQDVFVQSLSAARDIRCATTNEALAGADCPPNGLAAMAPAGTRGAPPGCRGETGAAKSANQNLPTGCKSMKNQSCSGRSSTICRWESGPRWCFTIVRA